MQKKGTSSSGVFDFSKAFDKEKLQALHTFMEKKQLSLAQVMADYLETLYQKHVPKDVRYYLEIDGRASAFVPRSEGGAVENPVPEGEGIQENPPP